MTDSAREVLKRIRSEIDAMEEKRESMEREEQAYAHNRGALGHE
jgi:FtsZ-binding cell division protein ZapB